MGVVYRAEERSTASGAWRSRSCRRASPTTPTTGLAFERESQMAAAIDDPNILPIYEAGEIDGVLFIAMRLCRGHGPGGAAPGWAARSAAGRPLAGPGRQRARCRTHPGPRPSRREARQRPHHRGPRRRARRARLPDRLRVDQGRRGIDGADQDRPVGRDSRLRGARADPRGDARSAHGHYALGGVLYHVLSGHPPYGRETEVAKIYAHLSRPPPELPADVEPRRSSTRRSGERWRRSGGALCDGRRVGSRCGRRSREARAGVWARGSPTVPAVVPAASEAGTAEPPSGATVEPARTTPVVQGPRPPEDVEQTPAEVSRRGDATVAGDTAGMPKSPPVQPTAPRRSRRPALLADRRKVGTLAVLAGAVFAVAGFLIGSAGGDDDAPSFTNVASAGSLQFHYPEGWQRRRGRSRFPVSRSMTGSTSRPRVRSARKAWPLDR